MVYRRRVWPPVDGLLEVARGLGRGGRVDWRAQLTEVVEVAGRLVGKVPDVVTESGAPPSLLRQAVPADPRQESGVLLRHCLQGVGR